MRRDRLPRPEPTTARGEVLLTHNHVSILNGLYDRPGGESFSSIDLARAALPYLRLFTNAHRSVHVGELAHRMHPSWITSYKVGSRRIWRITDRGRDIVELRVPAWLRGHGPYRGIAPLRPALLQHWREFEASLPSLPRFGDKPLTAWLPRIEQAVTRWKALQEWSSSDQLLLIEQRADDLDSFLRNFVLEFDCMPTGLHVIEATNGEDFAVDFDQLSRDR